MAKEHTYPNHTLEDHWRAKGWNYRVMWEYKGPPNTGVAWIVAYALNGHVVLVQTYKDGNGWEAYTPNQSGNIQETLDDVSARCGLLEKAEAA